MTAHRLTGRLEALETAVRRSRYDPGEGARFGELVYRLPGARCYRRAVPDGVELTCVGGQGPVSYRLVGIGVDEL